MPGTLVSLGARKQVQRPGSKICKHHFASINNFGQITNIQEKRIHVTLSKRNLGQKQQSLIKQLHYLIPVNTTISTIHPKMHTYNLQDIATLLFYRILFMKRITNYKIVSYLYPLEELIPPSILRDPSIFCPMNLHKG